jgi:uroporphyrinogen decarboxylase
LIFGRRLWQRFIKPRITRMYGMVKKAGKAVMIHSCGKVQELFPELIEAGLDIFNPFQPEVMDPFEIKNQFGNDLTFYGGVSIQKLLPFGTPAQIRGEVRRLIDQVGKDGGFIIAPSHEMPGDIPLENLLAFIEAARAG